MDENSETKKFLVQIEPTTHSRATVSFTFTVEEQDIGANIEFQFVIGDQTMAKGEDPAVRCIVDPA